ncbi:acyl-CoA-binding domain-containing protein 4 [Rhinoraja longicauda]
MEEVQSDFQRQFQVAVSVIQALPKKGSYQPSHEKMLKFYSYYKQATVGPCTISRPGFWDPVGRIKWDAWKALGSTSKREAMANYVEEIKKAAGEAVDKMAGDENAEQHFLLFQPLYEIMEDMPRPPGFHLKVPGKMVRFQEDVGKDDASDNGSHLTEDDHSESEGLDAEVEIFQLESTKDLVNTVQPESSHELQAATHVANGSNWNSTVDTVEANHLTSDSESEVFCDSVEDLMLENRSSCMIATCSQDSSASQDIAHPPHAHCDALPAGLPAGYQPTADDLHQCQHSCSNGNGEHALVVGSRKKGKTSFATHFLEPDELTKENGLRQVEGWSSRRLRNGLVHNMEDNKRQTHGGMGAASLDDKVGIVLLHLQEDMQNVLGRLGHLENLATSQMEATELQPSCLKMTLFKRTSRWLFSPSRRTLFFLVLWPFVAQWIVHALLRRRRT